MKIKAHHINGIQIAEIIADGLIINSTDSALEVIGNVYYQGYDAVIIHQKNITTEFFSLKSKLAGDILQKFSNYRLKLAIVGDYSTYTSKSLKDFIYESNAAKQTTFLGSVEEALQILAP